MFQQRIQSQGWSLPHLELSGNQFLVNGNLLCPQASSVHLQNAHGGYACRHVHCCKNSMPGHMSTCANKERRILALYRLLQWGKASDTKDFLNMCKTSGTTINRKTGDRKRAAHIFLHVLPQDMQAAIRKGVQHVILICTIDCYSYLILQSQLHSLVNVGTALCLLLLVYTL